MMNETMQKMKEYRVDYFEIISYWDGRSKHWDGENRSITVYAINEDRAKIEFGIVCPLREIIKIEEV